MIEKGAYNVFLFTETWHTASDDVALRRCVPVGYSCIDVPRPTTNEARVNHGGVAAVISGGLKYKVITSSLTATTFESVCFTIIGSATTVAVLLLYRPGSAAVTDVIFEEVSNCLEAIALYKVRSL